MEEQIQLYPYIEPDMERWPIHQLTLERMDFIAELNEHSFKQITTQSDQPLRSLLDKVLYMERSRINNNPWRVDPPDDKQFWKSIKGELEEYSSPEKKNLAGSKYEELVRRIIDRYSNEIVGSFVPKTYSQARSILTFMFKRLLINRGNKRVWGKKEQLYHRIKLYGDSEKIRELTKIGTVVMVPTHMSNLDSLLIAYAIDLKVGLPSFSWGAGLNLYNFGPAAYFMNRLGTYRVDRRKKNPIYLTTLKSMSTMTMVRGVHSLFYPGGTRSRSGEIETQCKLGLLGTTIEAQRILCQSGKDKKIFMVPLIIDYHFVLEAKYLIEQHLQEVGREHYAAIRDESKSKRKLLKFLLQSYRESSEIVMSLGEPFDVLGNFVNEKGESLGSDGKVLDVKDYFMNDDEVTSDPQRERVYTQILAKRILERFRKDNVVLSSHVVAYTAFRILVERYDELDIMGLLKLPQDDLTISLAELTEKVQNVLNRLIILESKQEIRLSDPIRWDLEEIVQDGLEKLGLYHVPKPLILSNGTTVLCKDIKLLYYYHNRLSQYDLESFVLQSKDRLRELSAV